MALAVDRMGNVYVARGGPYSVYRITPEGVITRILDEAGDNAGHRLKSVRNVRVDAKGRVYAAGMMSDNLLRFTPPATPPAKAPAKPPDAAAP